MKYKHDCKNSMGALGMTADDYERVIKTMDDILDEYQTSDKYSKNSHLIELLEKAARKDPLLLRYMLYRLMDYMLNPLQALEDSGAKIVNFGRPGDLPEDCPEEIREFVTKVAEYISHAKKKKDDVPIKH